MIIVAVASCVLTEHWLCRWTGQASTVGDWSIAITGLLYGLTLPPDLPLWMVFAGGVFGVGIGKFLFGGLGMNAFNPALVGRAFLQAAFPQPMTHWSLPFAEGRFDSIPSSVLAMPFWEPTYDAVTTATPLALMKFESEFAGGRELMAGLTSGSVGETCGALILLGGLYLVARNMMNWRIPASIFATVAAVTWAFQLYDPATYPGPVFMLFSGGLMLGAVFMATDMVASPITNAGCWLYGALIGVLVVVIRFLGRHARGRDVRDPAGERGVASYRQPDTAQGVRHEQGNRMNTPAPVPQKKTTTWEMYRSIVGIGAFCALLIVTVYTATFDRIADNRARFLNSAIEQVLPAVRSTVEVALDANGELIAATEPGNLPVFLGYGEDGELVGAVITAQGMGYADNITVLYSYSFDLEAIVGHKVLESKETPGLGDKVELEPHFLANFEALDARLNEDGTALANAIVTVKEGEKTEPWQVDGITGATITSVAIGSILNQASGLWLPVLERDAREFQPPQATEE